MSADVPETFQNVLKVFPGVRGCKKLSRNNFWARILSGHGLTFFFKLPKQPRERFPNICFTFSDLETQKKGDRFFFKIWFLCKSCVLGTRYLTLRDFLHMKKNIFHFLPPKSIFNGSNHSFRLS